MPEDIEEADNFDEDFEEELDEVETESDSPSEQPSVDQTKAFATRLKEEKVKAKNEVRAEIASSFGYDSWDAYMDAQTNNKLSDQGLDPEVVRPMLKNLIKEDPDYIAAMQFKQEKEELEKELFAKNSIQELNNTFGTNYSSINDLDESTINMWNSGISLDKAYAANHWSDIRQKALKEVNRDTGKAHLKSVDSGATSGNTTKVLTPEQLSVFKAFGFSEEQAKEYLNRTNK